MTKWMDCPIWAPKAGVRPSWPRGEIGLAAQLVLHNRPFFCPGFHPRSSVLPSAGASRWLTDEGCSLVGEPQVIQRLRSVTHLQWPFPCPLASLTVPLRRTAVSRHTTDPELLFRNSALWERDRPRQAGWVLTCTHSPYGGAPLSPRGKWSMCSLKLQIIPLSFCLRTPCVSRAVNTVQIQKAVHKSLWKRISSFSASWL